MAEKQERVHFYMSMKSIMDLPMEGPSDVPTMSVYEKVRPQGDFYFINPNITLKEDDWIIFGVASTDNVDLQNEAIDAKEVFGDHLDEFVSVGKIFYEHGYRYAKDASPSNRIDEPIGYPYMVEIFDNKLWIWAVLDKEHPLAQKVWESLSNSDERFRNKWGFSIGGILVGKPQATTNTLYGRVNRLPKMRLYEISVTPQPVNPYTWAQVVKSLVSEDSMAHTDDAEKKLDKETVNVEPGDKNDVTHAEKVDFGDDKAEGSPPAERKEGEDIVDVDVTKALDDANEEESEEKEAPEEKKEASEEPAAEDKDAGDDVLADALEKAAGEEAAADKPEEAGEAMAPEGEENSAEVAEEKPAEEAEATPEASPEEAMAEGGEEKGEGEDSVLVDLLGEGGEEEKAEESGDASIELVLDEISSLREVVDELTSRLSKLLEYEAQEHADESLEEGEGMETEGPKVSEEVLAKSLETQAQLLDTVEFLREEIETQKSMLAQALQALESQDEIIKALSASTSDAPSTAEEVLEARKNFDPTKKTVTKSVSEQVDVTIEPEPGSDEVVKALADTVEETLNDAQGQSKYDTILRDPELVEVAKSLADAYNTLAEELKEGKIRHSTYRTKSSEILEIAKSVLGLGRSEFLTLVNEG